MSNVLDVLGATGVVPVVVLSDVAAAQPLGAALKAGGLPIAEVTFRTAVAEDCLRELAADPDILVGAGTVIRAEQVDRAVAAGARFIVSPGLSQNVVRRAQELGVPVLPGIATPTELIAALDLGIEVVKLFPAESLGGLSTLAALAAAFPQVRFVPTGGIKEAQLAAYLGHKAVLAVGGSWMVAASLVDPADFAAVTRLSAAAVKVAREAGRS